MLLLLPQRVGLIVTTSTRPCQTRHGLSEWSGVAQFRPAANWQASRVLHVSFGRVVYTDYESCTRPISTNSGSMEACEYGLTRGKYFVARRLEVIAIAGLLGISCFFFTVVGYRVFYFERTRPAASMRPTCLIYLSTSAGVCTRCHYLIEVVVPQTGGISKAVSRHKATKIAWHGWNL